MLFNSYIFILLFIPLCLLGYFTLNKIGMLWANLFLLGMSLWFYGYFNPSYLLIILSSIAVNYLAGVLIGQWKDTGRKKTVLILAICINLGLLFYYKYMDFFLSGVNALFRTDIGYLNIVLPLGISFFTFQQISYVVDVYRGETTACALIPYACYVSFFPQLVAGPIVSHQEFLPDFLDPEKRKPDYDNLLTGVRIFSMGLAKKVLIADVFGKAADLGYDNAAWSNSFTILFTVLAYAIQLYFDFSGYSDMAIGLGRMFNIEIPVNFRSPYQAVSITDFWDRWHITLTRFFTRYVYIPLGGSRKGKARTYVNILIVFLLSGLWHGASLTFVFWGLCHGILLVLNRMFQKVWDKVPGLAARAVTFVTISLLWIFFRSPDFNTAFLMFSKIFRGGGGWLPGYITECFAIPEIAFLFYGRSMDVLVGQVLTAGFTILALGILFFAKNNEEYTIKRKNTAANAFAAAFLLIWCIFSFEKVSAFLYFNF
ncbi:MAG: MBOAT family protein [Lachnospiraceae bacterium]|nr:MBOAT family protein [Lachnospiraceae bacterium]